MMSAPHSKGRQRIGVGNVLSTMRGSPFAWATRANFSMSRTTTEGLVRVSAKTAFVFGRIAAWISSSLAQLAFLSYDLWIEISLHRQAADFYKLYDDRQAGDRALGFNVGKIPGINIHLFG